MSPPLEMDNIGLKKKYSSLKMDNITVGNQTENSRKAAWYQRL